ncbi:stage II sporulation protein AA (anti-sigma F factor antagonist) [Jatrophihabitans sp. GAS493]|uniref:STAS domain-containing protein n=1 Tax=Jatrophihabitans sp. GAS493 TaxID=1907575 RepID=UPI000BBF71E2|nr:STAS domain-containing protein [Jatrophihabitans sp. GAS493]SOD72516.1 stage II sporulation protein AA (anti-sigma F factor antagonist) [Jatrophihabitans sp. GAS493]
MTATVQTTVVDEHRVLSIAGELDAAASPAIGEQVQRLLDERSAGTIVIDLSDVSFLDSSALTMLIQARNRATADSIPLAVVLDDNDRVEKLIKITGLSGVFDLYPNVADALREERH